VGVAISLTFDCVNAVTMGEFWKLALGYEDNPPPAPYASREEWLSALGEPDTTAEDGAWLRDPDGVGPTLSILRVPEPKVAKNRLHIDVRVTRGTDPAQGWAVIAAKVAQLTEAGGTTLHEDHGHHVVMADPEGNEFCVC
jgi:hypothetical protein